MSHFTKHLHTLFQPSLPPPSPPPQLPPPPQPAPSLSPPLSPHFHLPPPSLRSPIPFPDPSPVLTLCQPCPQPQCRAAQAELELGAGGLGEKGTAKLSPFPPPHKTNTWPVPSAGSTPALLCSLATRVPPGPGARGVPRGQSGRRAGTPGMAQSSLAKFPMVTLRSCLLATSSWRCRAPPPMKQKAGQTGPEQSTPHSQSSRKETAS